MRIIVMLLLAVVSGGTAAEWVMVRSSQEEGVTVYADPSTIRRSGSIVKMWMMNDLMTVRVSGFGAGERYSSEKSQREFDCDAAKDRTLSFTWHSGDMGNGEVIYASAGIADHWTLIVPGSFGEPLWKFACGKQ